MTPIRSGAIVILTVLIGMLGGCASFNDTVVVDVGDQFDLLNLNLPDAQAPRDGARRAPGFECEFDARSERVSLLSGERRVSGTIRCKALDGRPGGQPSGQAEKPPAH
jgi:hypothetical protein